MPAFIARATAQDRALEPPHAPFSAIFRNATIWKLVGVYFLIQVGFYGLNTWLPTVVGDITGGAIWEVGLVTAIPYVVAMAGLWFNAKAADKTGRYSFHVFLSMLIGSVTLVISVMLGTATPILAEVTQYVRRQRSSDMSSWGRSSRDPSGAIANTEIRMEILEGDALGPAYVVHLDDKLLPLADD